MMRLGTVLACVAAMAGSVAMAAPAAAATPAPEEAPADPKVPFEKLTLGNGLEVILHEDRTVPLVHVNVWYHVGSGDEEPGKTGFAHLFEHMMFQGTKNTGEDRHFAILREIGGQDENGTTNPNRTNYYETVPAHQLEVALWLESERMGYLLGAVSEKSLENQKQVVRNERRQNYDNVPYGKDRFATAAALYPEGHPYRYLTIGRHEDLEAARLEDVQGFFTTWYRPSNATLCLAGDFEMATARKLVEKWFGSFPKLPKPEQRMLAIEKEAVQLPRTELKDHLAKLRRLHYVWHSPEIFTSGDAELDVASDVLGDPGTGRLVRRLVLEKRYARTVRVFQGSTQRTSAFHVTVDLLDGAPMEEVAAIVQEEIARIGKEPVSEAEMKRAITRVETAFVWGLEGLQARAEALQSYNHFLKDPDRIAWDLARYRKVTPAAVKESAAKYLAWDRRAEIVTMPSSEEVKDPSVVASAPATPAPPAAIPGETPTSENPAKKGGAKPTSLTFLEEAFRAERPRGGTPRPLVPPAVERFSIGEGVEVYLVERHQLPVVAMDLVQAGGRVTEPAGKEGIAALAANLMDDGTRRLEKVAFEEALGDLGSSVSASARAEEVGLSMTCLKRRLEPTLDLWAETLLSPGLRSDDHDRNVKQAVAALRQAKGAPDSLGRRVAAPWFWGADHPLGRVSTEAGLEGIGRDDVATFLAGAWKPKGARLFVMGDVTRAEVEALVGKRLAAWKGGAPASAEPGKAAPAAMRAAFLDVPGASQSMVVLGHPGPARQAADHVPTELLMDVLGGEFSSRINMNLREDKGWAYGAFGGVLQYRHLGLFQASANVRTDATKGSVEELLKEIRTMAEGGVKEDELTREKEAAILGLPGKFATGSDIIATFRELAYYGLPMDYYATYADVVKRTTKEQVDKAGKDHLHPGELRLLVVGDGAQVLGDLKALVASGALGDGVQLQLLDADGKTVTANKETPKE